MWISAVTRAGVMQFGQFLPRGMPGSQGSQLQLIAKVGSKGQASGHRDVQIVSMKYNLADPSGPCNR